MRTIGIKSALLGVAAIAALSIPTDASAQKLSELLPELLKTHDLVKAAQSDLSAATDRRREALGAWFPNMSFSSTLGKEDYNKPTGSEDTHMINRVLDLSVTQLLWDFGGTNASVRVAELQRDIASDSLDAARQDLILRTVTSYLNVKRAADALAFARESEENIKKQTELEDALVRRGAGISSDVLQAKQQLAGASARRVAAQGALLVAQNSYRAALRATPPVAGALSSPRVQPSLLPTSLKDAIDVALRENPRLSVASTSTHVSRESVKVAKGSLSPRIEAVASAKAKDNDGGTVGAQEEYAAKVQLTFPFNLGLTAVNTLNAAESTATATYLRANEQKHLVEEQVRNAWDNLATSRSTAEFLQNQANITAEFLELARKERQLGNRSLLDVLAGETALINANSDARSAQIDIQLWSFTLLNAMGRLTLDTIAD